MKTTYKIVFAGVIFSILLSSCKKFVDVNTNPNQLTTAQAQFVFTGALATTYRNQVGTMHIVSGSWTGFTAHSTSFTGGGAEKTYSITSADFNVYGGLYDNLADYEFVKDTADDQGIGFWKDPADIMQCYVFQQLVDLHGDVPYFEAFQNAANVTPAFTDAKTIYEDLIVRLDAAMANIAAATWPTDPVFLTPDIMFQGNKTNWIRFANTLKLRILMRQSFMPGRDAYISSKITATQANGYITGNVFINPGFQQVAGKLNPYYANYGFNELNNIIQGHQYRKQNAVIVNWLKTSATTNALPPSVAPTPVNDGTVDTFRLQGLVWPMGTTVTTPSANLANYVGVPLGIGSGYATANSSPQGPFQIVQGQGIRPGLFFLFAELNLLQAEASLRYGISFGGLTPEQLYNAGILSHFRTIAAVMGSNTNTIPVGGNGTTANAGDAFANRYIARPIANVNWTASPDKIRAILIQKWVTFTNLNGLEAWSEYRKSSGSASEGVPIRVKTVASTSNPEPTRFLYPLSETQANANNIPSTTSFTKIFWDVN